MSKPQQRRQLEQFPVLRTRHFRRPAGNFDTKMPNPHLLIGHWSIGVFAVPKITRHLIHTLRVPALTRAVKPWFIANAPIHYGDLGLWLDFDTATESLK